MKKMTIAMAALFCMSAAAHAEGTRRSTHIQNPPTQDQKFIVGVDGDFGIPLGSYGDVNGVGGGLLLTGEYPVMPELGLTGRVGFQYHSDKDVGGASAHVHSIPFLLGAKYYFMPAHQGFFGAAELGLFDLIAGASAGGISASDSTVKFGVGVGVGYQMKQWNARVNLHSQSVGSFGDTMMLTAGVGYQFAGF